MAPYRILHSPRAQHSTSGSVIEIPAKLKLYGTKHSEAKGRQSYIPTSTLSATRAQMRTSALITSTRLMTPPVAPADLQPLARSLSIFITKHATDGRIVVSIRLKRDPYAVGSRCAKCCVIIGWYIFVAFLLADDDVFFVCASVFCECVDAAAGFVRICRGDGCVVCAVALIGDTAWYFRSRAIRWKVFGAWRTLGYITVPQGLALPGVIKWHVQVGLILYCRVYKVPV